MKKSLNSKTKITTSSISSHGTQKGHDMWKSRLRIGTSVIFFPYFAFQLFVYTNISIDVRMASSYHIIMNTLKIKSVKVTG
jgi:hypothetical protein